MSRPPLLWEEGSVPKRRRRRAEPAQARAKRERDSAKHEAMRAAIKKRGRSQSVFRTHSEIWLVSDHPVRSSKVASRYFLEVASTPPLGGGEYLGRKTF